MHKGFKCLDIPTWRIYISRDVIFDESVFPFASLHSNADVCYHSEILLTPPRNNDDANLVNAPTLNLLCANFPVQDMQQPVSSLVAPDQVPDPVPDSVSEAVQCPMRIPLASAIPADPHCGLALDSSVPTVDQAQSPVPLPADTASTAVNDRARLPATILAPMSTAVQA
jgi:hypothetical protein